MYNFGECSTVYLYHIFSKNMTFMAILLQGYTYMYMYMGHAYFSEIKVDMQVSICKFAKKSPPKHVCVDHSTNWELFPHSHL